eukprot:scaffold80749_cov37-Tisochrysis_lutea.AAC.1
MTAAVAVSLNRRVPSAPAQLSTRRASSSRVDNGGCMHGFSDLDNSVELESSRALKEDSL